jgi:hypothetical protein
MSLANHGAVAALAGLNEYFDEVEQVAPWRWQCAMREEARLPVVAVFTDGFLRLAMEPRVKYGMDQAIDQALQLNAGCAGAVKAAIDPRGQQLKLYGDMVVIEESQVRARLAWALQSFCNAIRTIESPAGPGIQRPPAANAASSSSFSDLLRQTSWEFMECAADEWSVALDTDAAPPVRVRIRENGIFASVELARVSSAAVATRRALALFLLTTGGMLRFVRVCASDSETQRVFALQVILPLAPAPEELNHALASLSVAYRTCAREAQFLLDETAAGLYLAVRNAYSNN